MYCQTQERVMRTAGASALATRNCTFILIIIENGISLASHICIVLKICESKAMHRSQTSNGGGNQCVFHFTSDDFNALINFIMSCCTLNTFNKYYSIRNDVPYTYEYCMYTCLRLPRTSPPSTQITLAMHILYLRASKKSYLSRMNANAFALYFSVDFNLFCIGCHSLTCKYLWGDAFKGTYV